MKRVAGFLLPGILILGLLVWAGWRFSQPARAPQEGMPSLAAMDTTRVAAIVIKPGAGKPVRLEKHKGGWILAGRKPTPADRDYIGQLLDDLATMRIIRVVTHTHAHDAELGLDRGVHVRLLDAGNTPLLDIMVGKQASDLISTYVRKKGKPEVLAVDRALVWQISRPTDAWKAPSPVKTDKSVGKNGNRGAKASP